MKKVLFFVAIVMLVFGMLGYEGILFDINANYKPEIEKSQITAVNDFEQSSLLVPMGSGNMYYVSTSGNNSKNGLTQANAWRTISYAATQAKAGDTVNIKKGDYGDDNIIVSNSGNSGNLITFQGYNNTPGEILKNKDNYPTINGGDGTGTGVMLNSKSYIKWKYLYITNFAKGRSAWWGGYHEFYNIYMKELGRLSTSYSGYGLELVYCTNCIVDNVIVFDAFGENFKFEQSHYTKVTNCESHGVKWQTGGWSYAVQYYFLLQHCHDVLIRNVTTHNHHYPNSHWGHGITIKDKGTPYSYNNTVIDCVAVDHQEAFSINGPAYNNKYINCTANTQVGNWQGIWVLSGAHHNEFRGIHIKKANYGIRIWRDSEVSLKTPHNNTIVNCIFDNIYEVGINYWYSKDNSIKNCLFRGTTSSNDVIRYEYTNTDNSNKIRNSIITNFNTYEDTANGGSGNSNLTYSNFYNNLFSMPSGTGNLKVDPLFAENDYHLKSEYGRWNGTTWVYDNETSPCIDKGNPVDDNSNELKPNGGRINIGAYGNTKFASKSSATLFLKTNDITTTFEDDEYKVIYNASGVNPRSIKWRYSSNANWLTWGATNHTLCGTPTNADVGNYWVCINITDGNGSYDEHNFTLNVLNVNPKITVADIITAVEDTFYNNDYNSDDDGQGTITWSLASNASWLILNLTSGKLYGTPANKDVGWYWVNISVSDGNGGKDWHYFIITVLNENNPPIINTTDVTIATEDIAYYVDYNGFDNDSKDVILTWNHSTNANFLNLNINTGELSGTPTNSDVGTYWINISVWDNWAGMSYTNFSLIVINTNDPPKISKANINSCIEDLFYKVVYTAIDIDPTEDKLTWSLSTNAIFLSIDPNKGVLKGVPSNSDVGKYWLNVSVSDGKGGLDYSSFILTVLNSNDAPYIITENILTCQEDETYQVTYQAVDVDPSNDILVWTISTDAPFLTLDRETGVLLGTPNNDEVGSYLVNISVADNNGGTDLTSFTLTVSNVNDPPRIKTVDVTNCLEDQLYQNKYSSIDIDIEIGTTGDTLTWKLDTNADFLTIDKVSGLLSGIPKNEDVGIYWVNVSVSDEKGCSDFHFFTLTIENVNDPPTDVIIELENIQYYESSYQPAYGKATDPDTIYGDKLIFIWYSNVVGKIGTGQDINLSLPSGFHIITLEAIDTAGARSNATFELEVLQNPVIVDENDKDNDGVPNQNKLIKGKEKLDKKPKANKSEEGRKNDKKDSMRDTDIDWTNMIFILILFIISFVLIIISIFSIRKKRNNKNKCSGKENIIERPTMIKGPKKLPIKKPRNKLPQKKPPNDQLFSPITNNKLDSLITPQSRIITKSSPGDFDELESNDIEKGEEDDHGYECTRSGADLDKDDNMCHICNEKFESKADDIKDNNSECDKTDELKVEENNAEENETEEEGYECPDCGTGLSAEINICPKCGAEFEEET